MARPRSYNTEAIVLRTSPLGEADRLLTLITPGLGKLRATARGVRKPTSKLGGHLDLLTRSSLTLNKGQSLDTITGADTLEAFQLMKSDLDRLSRAIYMSELVEAFSSIEVPNPAAYTLFIESLQALGTEANPDLVLRYLEIQLMGHQGFLPELRQCVECRGEIVPKEHSFSPWAGGVLCSACRPSSSDAMPLSVDALKVLRCFSTVPISSAIMVRVNPPLHRELAALMNTFLRYILERELRSSTFLRSVIRTNPGVELAAPVPRP